jgi:hypothetical protein
MPSHKGSPRKGLGRGATCMESRRISGPLRINSARRETSQGVEGYATGSGRKRLPGPWCLVEVADKQSARPPYLARCAAVLAPFDRCVRNPTGVKGSRALRSTQRGFMALLHLPLRGYLHVPDGVGWAKNMRHKSHVFSVMLDAIGHSGWGVQVYHLVPFPV